MEFKLVVSDMDGTLLKDNKEISERNLKAIEGLRQRGIYFAPVTGRGTPGLMQYKKTLNQTEPCITYNGAMVVNPVTGQILDHTPLKRGDAARVLALGKEEGVNMFFWSDNRAYAYELNHAADQYAVLAGHPLTKVDSTEMEERLLDQGLTKILWVNEDYEKALGYCHKFQVELKDQFPDMTSVMAGPGYVDFINAGVSKGKAVEALARQYGIRREEVMAFGDNYNDLSMIEYAGMGVFMANSKEDLKARADYVTSSNEEDGVAEVIERFILN